MNTLRDIIADLRTHPGRNVLTAVSLFIGVLAVMAIIVTGTVVKEVFVSTAEQQGGRFQTFQQSVQLPAEASRAQLVTALQSLPTVPGAHSGCLVESSSTVTVASLPVSSATSQQGRQSGTAVRFVAGDYRSVYRMPIIQGRWLRSNLSTSPYEAVLNMPSAGSLGGVGTPIWLTSNTSATAFPVTVVGVVNDGSTQPVLYTNAIAWLTNAPQLLHPDTLTLLWQQPGTPVDSVHNSINQWLDAHQLPTNGEISETDTVAGFQQFITVMQLSFGGVAALSLLVAGLGIINVGLASVKERTRELVIRRAIGASKASIVKMIVGSSVTLSVMVAAVSALVAGAGLAVFRASLPHDTAMVAPAYPVTAAALGTAVAIATALAGSIIPAVVASRLQPALALRE